MLQQTVSLVDRLRAPIPSTYIYTYFSGSCMRNFQKEKIYKKIIIIEDHFGN